MVFRGSDDVRFLLGAVYGCIHGLRWTTQLSDGAGSVLVGEGQGGGHPPDRRDGLRPSRPTAASRASARTCARGWG